MKTLIALLLIGAFLVGFFGTTIVDAEVVYKDQKRVIDLHTSNVTCLYVKKTNIFLCY